MKFSVTRSSDWNGKKPCKQATCIAKNKVLRYGFNAHEKYSYYETVKLYGVEINSLEELLKFISAVDGKVIITDFPYGYYADDFEGIELPKYNIEIYDDYVE